MVQFRPRAREIIAKIVYYGPPLGGKTTNLRTLYAGYPPETRGELVTVPAGGDRTIFFDFLPVAAGTLRGMKVRVQLYTVPGQVHYNATRQVVLRGVDAVVFVADSQRELLRSNRESWENLKENLALQGLTLADVPHVLQYNKRDLQDLLSVDDLDNLLNEFNAPFFEAVATTGIGVEETLQGVVRLVARSLRERFRIPVDEGPGVLEEVPPGVVEELPHVFDTPQDVPAPAAPTFGVSSREASLGAPAPTPAPAPPALVEAPSDAGRFSFTFVGSEPAPRPDLGAPESPVASTPQAAPFPEEEVFGGVARSATPAVTGKILLAPLQQAPLGELPDLMDPFEAPPAGGDGAGADVFEAPPVPVAAAHEAQVEVLGAEPDLGEAFSVSERGPGATADLPAEAGRALVQRIIPRALAQVGDVRELELEVPVPAVWTGGKRLTLQFRLTLVPEEDAHAE